jgi:hypothetical protein
VDNNASEEHTASIFRKEMKMEEMEAVFSSETLMHLLEHKASQLRIPQNQISRRETLELLTLLYLIFEFVGNKIGSKNHFECFPLILSNSVLNQNSGRCQFQVRGPANSFSKG